MDSAALIPTPDAIPVHWGWFQLFLLLTFFIHILLMNVMLGTAFIALVSHFRRDASSPCTEAVSRNAYSLTYVYKYRYAQLDNGSGRLLVCGLITILLLVIAFIFSNILTLMQTPANWSRYFDQPHGLLLNLADPMLLPRYLHFMVSAVAVGGLAIALFFHRQHQKGDSAAARWITYGCRWFSYATILNGAVGIWFLITLPEGLLTISNISGLLLLMTLGGGIVLSVPAVLYGLTNRVIPTVTCALGTVALMILARSLLRTALLAPWFPVSQLPVTPSMSPFFLFLLILMMGLALIVWMVRFVLRSCADWGRQP